MTESPFVSRGREIIKEVMREHMLCAEDFFGTLRHQHLVKARRTAARRLRDADYTCMQIARMMKRNHTTVLNYFEQLPESKRKRRLFRVLTRNLSDDVHHAVIDIAKAEGVSLEILVSQWVTERVRYELEAKSRSEREEKSCEGQRLECAELNVVAA
jgi:intein-encoded DNA endonuclease-like protein